MDEECITVSCWNSNGMSDSRRYYLMMLMETCHIIAISEHWLHDNRLHVLYGFSEEFSCIARAHRDSKSEYYGKPGKGKGQGGVALLWRKSLNGISPMPEIVHDGVCGIRLQTGDRKVIIFLSVYFPTACSKTTKTKEYRDFSEKLGKIIKSLEKGCSVVILGDFNGNVGNLCGTRSTNKPNKNGVMTAEFFEMYLLFPVNMCRETATGPVHTFKGRRRKSTLDYIAVANDIKKLFCRCEVIKDDEFNVSDHYAIKVDMDIELIPCNVEVVKEQGRIEWKSSQEGEKYRIAVDHKMKCLRDDVDLEHCSKEELEEAFNRIIQCLIDEGNKLPKTTYVKENIEQLFLTDKLSDLMIKMSKCYKEYEQAGSPRNTEKELYKLAKKNFKKESRKRQKVYERKKLLEINRCASYNKNTFWNEIEKCCNPGKCKNVVYDAKEVVKAWKVHLRDEYTHCDFIYDTDHVDEVKRSLEKWRKKVEEPFEPFTNEEIYRALKELGEDKLPGYDEVTAEHLVNAGEEIVSVLTALYNRMFVLEYVPINFRGGTQVPLSKGENSSPIDPNSYSSNPLLTCFNNMFEILIWGRMRESWEEKRVCRKGNIYENWAFLLQESIAIGLGTEKKRVYVAYIDTAMALHSVWIDDFFFDLHEMGVTGKMWRILYNSYKEMKCGIHQGRYLLQLKYAAFVDPLLKEIGSRFSHEIIATGSIEYDGALFICSQSEDYLNKAIKIVSDYARRWHYLYNASKSVIILDRKRRKVKLGVENRNFSLGKEIINEKSEYNHLEMKNIISGNIKERIEDRIRMGWERFYTVTGAGIKEPLPKTICTKIYRTGIIPRVTYGSELWVYKNDDVEMLSMFQNSLADKFKKLSHSKCPFKWLSIDKYIKIKKMVFLKSILNMHEDSVCRKILRQQADKYDRNKELGDRNDVGSPVYDLLNVCKELGMYNMCLDCIKNGRKLGENDLQDIIQKIVLSM